MMMLMRLKRALAPLDTSEADAALDRLERSQHVVKVHARALRMDICCGDPKAALAAMSHSVVRQAGHLLRAVFGDPTDEPLPPDMRRLLDKLD